MHDIIAKIDEMKPCDILFGRGSAINNHEGNIKFRVFCDRNKKHYIESGKKKGRSKYKYCTAVLKYFKSTGCRFIQFDKTTDSWYEVDDNKARTRIDRRFREPHSSKTIEYSAPPAIISTAIKRSRGITSIGPNHVLFGSGKRIDTNKGNVRFRDYCTSMGGKYASLHTTKEKTQLTYQMLDHLYSMGFVFLSYYKQQKKWFRVEHCQIRDKISKRLRLSVRYDKGEGKLSSCVLKGFLKNNNVKQHITNIFDNMLNHPSKDPTVPGMKGINAMVDLGPYNKKNRNVNINRLSTYTRNEFGNPIRSGELRGGRQTLVVPAYGTCTGDTTHGTSVDTKSFRPFDDNFKVVASKLKAFIRKRKGWKTSCDFNMSSFILYEGKKAINPHRDNVFRPDGSWNDKDNCQVRYTPVATVVYGADRKLLFQLYRHKDVKRFPSDQNKKGPIKVGKPIVFKLKHGDVVYLDNATEELRWRRHYYTEAKTFFKHYCDGVEGKEGLLSLGLVFRVGRLVREVYADTGMLVLTPEEVKSSKGNRVAVNNCMREYLTSNSKTDGDKRREQMWSAVKTNHRL